ncbi:hypothetical protein PR002_g8380 [Phytophthora rubi]|uniref:Uncharacterized protein n=1 Tax=Phytophthora rubi TaxID=129364 RepID=A0A6A3MQW4_9STRA|nr:hypothetical protein PR002_g8380 [Phytophthora rubi]
MQRSLRQIDRCRSNACHSPHSPHSAAQKQCLKTPLGVITVACLLGAGAVVFGFFSSCIKPHPLPQTLNGVYSRRIDE